MNRADNSSKHLKIHKTLVSRLLHRSHIIAPYMRKLKEITFRRYTYAFHLSEAKTHPLSYHAKLQITKFEKLSIKNYFLVLKHRLPTPFQVSLHLFPFPNFNLNEMTINSMSLFLKVQLSIRYGKNYLP